MLNNHQTPEQAEELFHLSEIIQTPEQLRDIFNAYVIAEKQYNAYTFALDFFDIAKPLFDELAQNYEYDYLFEVFILLCCEKDKDRATSLAIMLVDQYTQTSEYEKIMDISALLTDSFSVARDSTQSVIILKSALNAAINIVEETTDEYPDNEVVMKVCETLSILPTCFMDGSFMYDSLHRIASCYNSEYTPKLALIATFLPAIRQGLDVLQKHFENNFGVGDMTDEDLQGILEVCNEYYNILFAVEHPEIVDGKPYTLNMDTADMDKHLTVIREEQNVYNELMNLPMDAHDMLPKLRERHTKLINYFSNFDNASVHFSDIEIDNHIMYCISAWRKIDLDYCKTTIEPYVERILAFTPDEATKKGTLYAIQVNLTFVSEIYAYDGDAMKEFECHMKFLKLGNTYLKRICFENGIDYFLENTKQEYLYYHYILNSTAQLAQEHGFAVNDLYFELCKRKNIFYLGEMWQKQGSSAKEIHNLLRKDFVFGELQAAIPAEGMLIDFFYVRPNFENNKAGETDEARINSTCIAFSLTSKGDVRIHFVSDGVKLVEYMNSKNEFIPYFKWITKRLLADRQGINRLLVCTEGDLNQLSFTALPFADGYVTDYNAVRNIASVLDIVYPHKKKKIKNALVVSSPDFGTNKECPNKWIPLYMSRKESEYIIDVLHYKHSIEVDLVHEQDATAENVTAGFVSQSYNAVHISTHGYFEADNVYMVMARANCEDIGTTIISDSDFGAFSLESTALVTLALCFGARQNLFLQDSLSGFIKASLLAGANTIIAPTAPISDLSTAIFMSEFYSRYLAAYEVENAEVTMQKSIAAIRVMSKNELFEKYYIEVDEEYPFTDVQNWGSWVCFSAEEVR